METITIETWEGPQAVRAEVFGPLAVHPNFNGSVGHTVTHILTGKAIIRNLSKSRALAAAMELQALDWDHYDKSRKAEFQAAVKRAATLPKVSGAVRV